MQSKDRMKRVHLGDFSMQEGMMAWARLVLVHVECVWIYFSL